MIVIPLKVMAVAIVYGCLFRLMSPLGWIGWIAAFVSGSSFAGMVCLAGRHDIIPLVRLSIYMFIGAVIGSSILAIMFMPRRGSHEVSQIQWTMFGIIVGALLAMLVNDSHRRPPASSD